MPSHYLNQCRNSVNWSPGNKFQWNFYQTLHIFIQENAFENVARKLAVILPRPQYVKGCTTYGSKIVLDQFAWMNAQEKLCIHAISFGFTLFAFNQNPHFSICPSTFHFKKLAINETKFVRGWCESCFRAGHYVKTKESLISYNHERFLFIRIETIYNSALT